MLMYGGNGVQLLPRFQDNKFQALLNEHQNTIEDPIQEKTEMPGKIHPFNIYQRGCREVVLYEYFVAIISVFST